MDFTARISRTATKAIAKITSQRAAISTASNAHDMEMSATIATTEFSIHAG